MNEDTGKNKENIGVPYIVFEGEMARQERHIKRLVTALIITIVLLFITNAIWLYAWTRYDYEGSSIEYSQDGEGFNNINTGDMGDVNNGAEIDSENEETDT